MGTPTISSSKIGTLTKKSGKLIKEVYGTRLPVPGTRVPRYNCTCFGALGANLQYKSRGSLGSTIVIVIINNNRGAITGTQLDGEVLISH